MILELQGGTIDHLQDAHLRPRLLLGALYVGEGLLNFRSTKLAYDDILI